MKHKVRIPAMVGPDGKWAAYGYGKGDGGADDPDWGMLAEIIECFDGAARCWIDVELPESGEAIVKATAVTEADETSLDRLFRAMKAATPVVR